MEQQILDILRRVCNNAQIDANATQQNCKEWDSLNHLNLVVELEMEFGISFEPEEIASMNTFKTVVSCVKSKM